MTIFAAIGKSEISTEAFAKHFFSLLCIPFEERESSHYIDGGYFNGSYNNITFMVYTSDKNDTMNMPVPMPLIICVDGNCGFNDTAVNDAIDFIFRSKLIPLGYKFLRYEHGNWLDFS